MKKYEEEYDNGNEYINDKHDAKSGPGGPIFDTITIPWYHGGISGNNIYGAYGHGSLYIHPFKDVPFLFGILD